MTYMGWQLNTKNIPESFSDGLKWYISKYGMPPQILVEVSPRLEQVPLPDGMRIVVKVERILQPNVILIANNEEVQTDPNA